MGLRQDRVTFRVIPHPVPEFNQSEVSGCLPEHCDHVCQSQVIVNNVQ